MLTIVNDRARKSADDNYGGLFGLVFLRTNAMVQVVDKISGNVLSDEEDIRYTWVGEENEAPDQQTQRLQLRSKAEHHFLELGDKDPVLKERLSEHDWEIQVRGLYHQPIRVRKPARAVYYRSVGHEMEPVVVMAKDGDLVEV